MLTENHPFVAVAATRWTDVMRDYAAADGSDPATCPPPTAATIAAWINASALEGEPLMAPRVDDRGLGNWSDRYIAYTSDDKHYNLAALACYFDDIPSRAA